MTVLDDWFRLNVREDNTAELFAERDLVVDTFVHNSMRKLQRSEAFDDLMISTVEAGLEREDWEGFLYVMHYRRGGEVLPLYIGKAERKGTTKPISYNLKNIRRNQHAFGRWGYGLAYHIGDLSHAMYQEKAYKKPSKKYRRWADALFERFDPPVLKERVYVAIVSWHEELRGPSGLLGSVPAIEKEIISLASASHGDLLLNVDGR